MEDFVLKDQLRHWAYVFPETMLIYEMKGKAPNLTADILCMDGKPVPYEAETTNDGYRLKVMADLPYRGEHTFTWKKGKNSKDRSVTALRSHYLRYFSIVSLNKVKDYVLEWEDDKNSYPKYFCVQRNTKRGGFYKSHVGKPSAADMMNILDRDATLFTTLEEIAPVSCRAFRSSWAQTFDLTASELTDEEFSRVRAAMALVCYTLSDENYYPTDTILAGHPNFLTDVAGTVAVFASLLGANHPMHQKWLKYYEMRIHDVYVAVHCI